MDELIIAHHTNHQVRGLVRRVVTDVIYNLTVSAHALDKQRIEVTKERIVASLDDLHNLLATLDAMQ